MNTRMIVMAILIATTASFVAQSTYAQSTNSSGATAEKKKKRIDLKKDFATLGDNGDLEERAKNLSSNQRVEVVQNRIVDRYNRFEIGGNLGMSANGDPYIRTENLGLQLDYHFTPQWSLGARYYHSYNQFTDEYNNATIRASNAQSAGGTSASVSVPAADYVIDTEMAVVNFYPIYGKLNMFDSGVTHFDLYLLAGGGQVQLLSGNSTTYTGGAGVGVWLSQHLSLRAELRYQGYTDFISTKNRQENLVQGQVGVGFLL